MPCAPRGVLTASLGDSLAPQVPIATDRPEQPVAQPDRPAERAPARRWSSARRSSDRSLSTAARTSGWAIDIDRADAPAP